MNTFLPLVLAALLFMPLVCPPADSLMPAKPLLVASPPAGPREVNSDWPCPETEKEDNSGAHEQVGSDTCSNSCRGTMTRIGSEGANH